MSLAISLLLAIRAVQTVFTIIVLGLSAYVAHWWSGYWHSWSPSEVNFLIFAAVWTLLALIYLIITPARFPRLAHMFAVLAVEVLTMVFWFAGFVALAVFLSDRVCFGSVCSCAKAACVFAAFEWALFALTSVLCTLDVLQARRGSSHSNKPSVVQIHQGV